MSWELLAYLTAKDLDEEDGRLAGMLAGERDWERLILDLGSHGLLEVFGRSLRLERCEDRVPQPVLELLEARAQDQLALAFVREHIASQVLGALDLASIEIMPLKGLHLSENVYDCPGIRPFSDIDLMVRRESVGDCARVLTGLGLEPQANHTPTFRSKGSPEVIFEVGAFRQQVKRSFRQTYLLDADEVWTSARKTHLLGMPVLEMRPEHLLVYLGLHLMERHQFEKLIWLRDLREVIDRYEREFDWDYFLDVAGRWRARTYAYFSLLLGLRLAGARVSADVLERLRPRYVEARLFELAITSPDGPRLPMPERSVERQLLSVLGDTLGRRVWAEAAFPVHATLRAVNRNGKRRRVQQDPWSQAQGEVSRG